MNLSFLAVLLAALVFTSSCGKPSASDSGSAAKAGRAATDSELDDVMELIVEDPDEIEEVPEEIEEEEPDEVIDEENDGITLEGGVVIEDVIEGAGAEAELGKTITVHATGTLTDGTKFWSSKDGGEKFTTPLQRGRLIDGWIIGVPGMKVGGTRRIFIPSDKGYGVRGSPPTIPANADLMFEIELYDVR